MDVSRLVELHTVGAKTGLARTTRPIPVVVLTPR